MKTLVTNTKIFLAFILSLLLHREYLCGVGDGDDREDISKRIYRKMPLLLQSNHLIFHQSTHILPAALILPKESRG
jgi:hypothetical protein